ncbi:MAG TPA: DUF58 domain-containing protein [Planctomycetaceae bacterium]|nr:DUF58 domain-containing protein [Planctomycetaceae bacterium]
MQPLPNAAAEFSLIDWGITPWTALLACALPLLALIFFQRIYPTGRLAWLASIPFWLSLLIPWSWSPSWWWMMVALSALVIALLAVMDLLTLPALGSLQVSRQMQRVASLGNTHQVELTIDNRSHRTLSLWVRDDTTSGDMEICPESQELRLAPQQRGFAHFKLIPRQRGEFSLAKVYTQVFSLGGLWRRLVDFSCPAKLHVYPNIKQIGEYALLARTNRLSQIGVRRTRKAGQDSNFERLRDYQQDDNYRHIDWRSTARRQKLTVKQFQTDQSQRVIFLLDCGRMMTNEHQQMSLLDYALNSTLMLSYVALSQGDSVGMICFSDRIHAYVPPAGGKGQMNRILHAGFNQFPQLVQSRFDDAFLYLSNHCRRRSLVVLISNVIDQVNADEIQNYMGNLIGCHLPLMVLLRDHRIFDAADNPAPDPEVLYRSAAAAQLLLWRHHVLQRLKATGTLALDGFPEEMTANMINQYLDIKARHAL